MSVAIRIGSAHDLALYETISPRFLVVERLDLAALPQLAFVPIEPFSKDYDSVAEDRPTMLATRFALDDWLIGMAEGGGAIIAPGSARLVSSLGDPAAFSLHDIRVAEDRRCSGLGSALLDWACSAARAAGASSLNVETQDINAVACRFYNAKGFSLAKVVPDAYPDLDESMLIWTKPL